MDVTTSEWLRNDSSSSLLSLNVVRGITTDSGFSTLLLLGYRSKTKRAPIQYAYDYNKDTLYTL